MPAGPPIARTLREVAALLGLLVSPRMRRAARVYEVIADHNHLGHTARYLNLGYWAEARDYDAACAALARLLGERAALAPGQRVLDAGFGFGDQAILWVEAFGVAQVVGLNVSPRQVEAARARVRDDRVDLRLGSATEIPFENSTFDRVVALESAFHFHTRETFFAEARRVLRPRGRIALADYIPLAPDYPRGRRLFDYVGRALWQIPRANMYAAPAYAERMRAAGFVDVRVESIREHVFGPFRAFAQRRQSEADVAARANPVLRSVWRSSRNVHAAMDYIIATGDVRGP